MKAVLKTVLTRKTIPAWTALINEAVSKVWDQYKEILQDLFMEGHDESKKDPIHKKIMATRDDYVNNDMLDPDEAIEATVDKRKFLLKRLLGDQGRFPEQ